MPYKASLAVAVSKSGIPQILNHKIVAACTYCIEDHGCFTIALSGGSLPKFLSSVPHEFEAMGVDPQWDKWHVLLADERVVPGHHDDNNMKALRENFLKNVPIPEDQIYDIEPGYTFFSAWEDETIAERIADWYEKAVVNKVLDLSDGLDLAVLGFGPDGHTCSLFPDHPLLDETTLAVAPIADSPKPPPKRITLTFPVLNRSKSVIFCGAGGSKTPILKAVFEDVVPSTVGNGFFEVTMTDPAPYPCGMVRPDGGVVYWIIDADAADGLAT